ncbi:TlpA disulfide reductase family protein [Ramlibacter sp.]|uniref:TlpA family protein disulfide reductase n=1 Tax=Ramlibacter sp. TaxID=1917967 RepID=UPI002C0A4083|nr:TlpA disulfide reductase family protein [Ramlibacter sp.]HWI84437.1 TlpA disulfide reductase family protein [Ramlibacter sp.]
MTQSLQLGPLSFPAPVVLALFALALAMAAGQLVAWRTRAAGELPLFPALTAGLVAARLAYVAQWHEAYLPHPLEILDIRDGGWSLWPGLAAGAAVAVVIGIRRAPWRLPLAAAAATGALAWLVGSALLTATDDSTRLPQLALPDVQGQPVALAAFHGKPTVVNLWATWCPPCRREMPVLLAAQGEHPDIHFVFVNERESAEQVRRFLAREQLPLRNVLLDAQGQAATQLGARGLPTTFFFDAQGRLVDARVGELSRATLADKLAALSAP